MPWRSRIPAASVTSPLTRHPSPRSGVALIVTIIMLAVITFLAVAFLALSGREKGSVKTATNQATAKQAAEAALERVKVELIANMLATTNPANFGLLVSTNYINWEGFDTAAVDPLTNVNYDYRAGGGALTPVQVLQNLGNLLYSPRAPVFITNRLAPNSTEFRYYLDLNRNGRHDRTGYLPVTNDLGQAITSPTNLNVLLTDSVKGDPEWISILDRPNQPHGPENRFTARIAYAVVPTGNTLDVNYIHNQAKRLGIGADGYYRNQGVGAWELNLAAFFADLNTNLWIPPGAYNYVTNPGTFSTGVAFDDALSFVSYRYDGTYNSLTDPLPPFEPYVDYYGNGPLMLTNQLPLDANDINPGYPGADNANHFFTTQDFFDRTKSGYGAAPAPVVAFPDRLAFAGTSNSTYNSSTYYRLLEQLGTDSAPEDPGKLNLNYVNVDGYALTNYLRWEDPNFDFVTRFGVRGSVLFFTNAVDRLLRAYTTEWLAADYANYTNTFKIDQPFGVTGIPVYVDGRMTYAPAVQRILQMAANIWDAKTNRYEGNIAWGTVPTVFAPLTVVSNNAVYITGYREVTNLVNLPSGLPLDLSRYASNNLASITNFQNNGINLIYGVPLVIGARKGLPNFNEFALDTTFTLERKLELIKAAPGGQSAITQTNQLYTLNVAVECGSEFWNSYRTNYTRPVNIVANNQLTFSLMDSNYPSLPPITNTFVSIGLTNTSPWLAWTGEEQDNSFIVPFRTNISFFIPRTTGYWPGSANYVLLSASIPPYEVDARLLMPNWSLEITNRVQAVITDQATGQIIDYVMLGDMTYRTNLLSMFGQDRNARGFTGVWATNAVGTQMSGRLGVLQQILISMGNATVFNTAPDEWESDYGTFTANRAHEIAKFGAFFLPPGSAGSFTDPATGEFASAVNSSNRAYTPFNPSVTFTVPMSWQANDPLVHYNGRDMLDLKSSGIPVRIKPSGNNNTNAMANIGLLNARYQPWGRDSGDPDAFNAAIKDPLVRRSDDWQFPTNTLPTLGWLGRIHRGSPWQTIYLKSSNVGLTNLVFSPAAWALNPTFRGAADKWAKWTGNRSLQEGFYSRPVMDRLLFDVFTTALNDNAARGRLPINQRGLAAWSALFSGMVVLTNDTPTGAGISTPPQFSPHIIQPAGVFDAFDDTTWSPVVRLVNGINQTRSNLNFFRNGTFERLGDILAVPELTDESPFLNRGNNYAVQRGLNDAAYEWLPQQMMSLVQLGTPRFVVYSYGQALQPAPDSIIPSGPYAGLCTNYAITAEVALRAVVKVVGSPDPARTQSYLPPEKRYPPRAVVESFNYLGPE